MALSSLSSTETDSIAAMVDRTPKLMLTRKTVRKDCEYAVLLASVAATIIRFVTPGTLSMAELLCIANASRKFEREDPGSPALSAAAETSRGRFTATRP